MAHAYAEPLGESSSSSSPHICTPTVLTHSILSLGQMAPESTNPEDWDTATCKAYFEKHFRHHYYRDGGNGATPPRAIAFWTSGIKHGKWLVGSLSPHALSQASAVSLEDAGSFLKEVYKLQRPDKWSTATVNKFLEQAEFEERTDKPAAFLFKSPRLSDEQAFIKQVLTTHREQVDAEISKRTADWPAAAAGGAGSAAAPSIGNPTSMPIHALQQSLSGLHTSSPGAPENLKRSSGSERSAQRPRESEKKKKDTVCDL